MSKKVRDNSPLWHLQMCATIRAGAKTRPENGSGSRAGWFQGALGLAGFVTGVLVAYFQIDGSWNTLLVFGAAGVSLGILVHLLLHRLIRRGS